MRKEKTLDFGHCSIKVHEPTVEQVRNLIGREDISFDPIGFLSGATEIPTDLLALVTDTSREKLEQLTLSELKELMEAAKEMLRPFVEMLEMCGTVAGYLAGMRSERSTPRS